MLDDSKWITISLAIAVGAFSLLFFLGMDHIQQNALPVCGGSVFLWIVIFGGRYFLAEIYPSWVKRNRKTEKARQLKIASKKEAKAQVDHAKWEIENAFETLAKGDPVLHEKAINDLVKYGSALVTPMCESFMKAIEAHQLYYQKGNPYHYHSPGAYGGPGLASWSEENIKHREWEHNGDRIKSMIFYLSDGLCRLGDPDCLLVLEYGYDYFNQLKNRKDDGDKWTLVQFGQVIHLNKKIKQDIDNISNKKIA